jgi:chromosome segregation ATPase
MLEAIRNLFNLSSPRSNAATLRRLTRHAHQDRESLSALLGTVQSIVSRLDVLEAHRGGAADAAQEALAALREITTDADEKVAQLHRLAEHVLQKMRALEGQKAAVDRAVQEAARVNDMVWTMEGQIGKLEAALRDAVRGEETAVRIQKMVEDIDGRIDVALKLRTEFMRDASRFEREGTALTTSIRHSLESLTIEQAALEALRARVERLEQTTRGAEVRTQTLATEGERAAGMRVDVDALATRLDALGAQVEAVDRQQAALAPLEERLERVDDLARQTSVRYDSLRQSRHEVEGLRRELQEFHRAHADAALLRDRLAGDRTALEALAARVVAARAEAPALVQQLDALADRFETLDTAGRRAERLETLSERLDAHMMRVEGHLPLVQDVERRLQELQAIAADVERRTREQTDRRAQLQDLQTSLEALTVRADAAHRRLGEVTTLGALVPPLEDRLADVTASLDALEDRTTRLDRQEQTFAAARGQVDALLEECGALAGQTEGQVSLVRSLQTTVVSADETRQALLTAVARIERRQHEVLIQSEIVADQMSRIAGMHRSLDARRGDLHAVDRHLATVEARLDEVARRSAALDEAVRQVADGESTVAAVKAQVEAVRQIAASSREDLDRVSAERDAIAGARTQVDALLAATSDVEDKMATLDARGKSIFWKA